MHRQFGIITLRIMLVVTLAFSATLAIAADEAAPAVWPPAQLSSLTEADWSSQFEQMRAAQRDFNVQSIADFKEMTAHYIFLKNDGTTINQFHLADGGLVQCVVVTTQRSYLAQASQSTVPSPPSVGANAPFASSPAAMASAFGLDGTVDDDGNVRHCSEGSVPHLIPSIESIYRFRTLGDFFSKSTLMTDASLLELPGSGDPHEWSHAYRFVTNWGSSGVFNVWSPYVEPANEFSLSQLWVTGGTGSGLQTAEAGWQKYPMMYGDGSPHLFIYYTTSNYAPSAGCYNLTCSGFVQTNPNVLIGGALSPVSVLGGQQAECQIALIRNATAPFGWWLQFNGVYVGYYPASLYNTQGLAVSSSKVDFGGEIVNVAQGGFHTTTQMGSGASPAAGLGNAAYTRLLQYVDTNNTMQAATGLSPNPTAPAYYGLSLNPSSPTGWGQWFLFGGPGRTTSPISFANATASVTTIAPGQTFTIDYSIVGTDQTVTVMLGASLGHYSTSSWPYSDAAHDISVSVPGFSSSLRSRQFTVSTSVPQGTYDLAVALWRDRNGNGIIDSADEVLGEKYLLGQIVVSPVTFGLSVSGAGTGQGTVTGNGINCAINAGSTSGTCSASYASGTAVSLSATPSGGSTFSSWGGACAGTGGCGLTMNASKSVSASFTAPVTNYTLSVTGGGTGQGTVTGSGINCSITAGSTSGTCSASYASGTAVSLTATPTGGSTFSSWGGACAGTGGCGLTMNASKSVSASFTAPVTNYTLAVTGGGTGQGTVTGSGINCTIAAGSTSGTCSASYASGTAVSLTATATGGSTFSSWGGACAGTGGCDLTMNASKSVSASFTAPVNGGTHIRNDFDGDGKADVVWRHTVGTTAVWSMNGGAVLSGAYTPLLDGTWILTGTGDFNGDGKTDLLWRYPPSGLVAVWLMNGTSIISSAYVNPLDSSWKVAGVGDFDGDGKDDVLWRHSLGINAVWFMNGAAISSGAYMTSVTPDWAVAAVGDFNGDHKADILWRHTSGINAVWLMNGVTMTTGLYVNTLDSSWTLAATGDYDGDGKADVLWRSSFGTNAIWFMNGAAIRQGAYTTSVDSSWAAVASGDFNGDGKADLMWRSSDSRTAIWIMNGTGISGTYGPLLPTSWNSRPNPATNGQ